MDGVRRMNAGEHRLFSPRLTLLTNIQVDYTIVEATRVGAVRGEDADEEAG
jgi:hypothetical protein